MPTVKFPWGDDKIFMPDRDEWTGIIREAIDTGNRVAQRGKKRMEFMIPGAVPLASTFFINNLVDEGYIWSLRLASCTLSSSGALQIYKASQTGDTRRALFNGASATTQIATWSSDQARMRHSDGLYFVASAGNVTNVFLSAWQVPAEMEGEIYD